MNISFLGALFLLWLQHPVACSIGVSVILGLIVGIVYVISHLRWKQ